MKEAAEQEAVPAGRPVVMALAGGGMTTEIEDREWREAWAHIARGCDRALTELHPQHPRRSELLHLSLDAYEAAGLRRAPALQSA